MAYDYQDPYYGYYPDSGYGYDEAEYSEPYTKPAPDKNWVDPVQVNRQYLNKIKQSCVHEGFEGLKEDGLFLLEATVRSVSLKRSVADTLVSKGESLFRTFVKFLDTPFVEVDETETAPSDKTSGEYKTNSVLANRKSFTNLLQTIYTSTGDHDSMIPEVQEDTENEELNESKDKNAELVDVDTKVEDVKTVKILKGKSVLLSMPGLVMIQKLQQYSLILKVTQWNVEGELIATSCIRLPQVFQKAVLMSCKPTTILPLVVVATNTYKLVHPERLEVGDAELILVLTCFGKGAVNCVSEEVDSHDYAHTFLLRHLRTKHVVADESLVPKVDPRLAKEIIKLGLFYTSQKTSSEVLQHCRYFSLIPEDETRIKSHKKKRDCNWFRMLKKACPSSSHSFDLGGYLREVEKERAALWRKHKEICRDLKTAEPVSKSSLEDRFREVQLIQTGVTEVMTGSPFREARQTLP